MQLPGVISRIESARLIGWWLTGLLHLLPPSLREKIVLRPDLLTIRIDEGTFHFSLHRGESGAVKEERRCRRGNDLEEADLRSWFSGITGASLDVHLYVPPVQVLARPLQFPLAAERDLRDILTLELDRLTPFNSEQVYFDHVVIARDETAQRLNCIIAVTRRDFLDGVLAELEEMQIRPNAVCIDAHARINLLPAGRAPSRESGTARQSALLAGVAFALLLLCTYAPLLRQESVLADWRQRVEDSKRYADEARLLTAQVNDARARQVFLANKRSASPQALDVLRELTLRLPDDAWINRLLIGNGSVQLNGEANAATALVPLLEESPYFEGVEFRSPLTRNEATGKDRFHLAATLTQGKGS